MNNISKPEPTIDDLQAWLESDAAPAEFYEAGACRSCPVARFLQHLHPERPYMHVGCELSSAGSMPTGFPDAVRMFDRTRSLSGVNRLLTRAEALAALVAHRRGA